MKVEDEHLDVLQNIEFAIISVYRERHEVRDSIVSSALDALVTHYKAESRGHTPREVKLPELEALIFARVQEMCELRLGRGGLGLTPTDGPTEKKTVDEILACLKRIQKSVERWNKRGGQRGYLTFVDQFIK